MNLKSLLGTTALCFVVVAMASLKAQAADDAPSDELLLSHMDTDDPSLRAYSSLDGGEISVTSSLTGLSARTPLGKEAINVSSAVPRTIRIQSSAPTPEERTAANTSTRTTGPRHQGTTRQQTPFAQLCLNQRDGSIVPMLETSQRGGRASRRVELTTATPETFPSMTTMSATTATSSSLSYSSSCTLSTLTEEYSTDDFSDSRKASSSSPIVLGTTPITEIDENGVALLNGETSPRRNIICSRAFKKIISFRALKMRKVNARCWGDSSRPMMTRFNRERGYEPL